MKRVCELGQGLKFRFEWDTDPRLEWNCYNFCTGELAHDVGLTSYEEKWNKQRQRRGGYGDNLPHWNPRAGRGGCLILMVTCWNPSPDPLYNLCRFNCVI